MDFEDILNDRPKKLHDIAFRLRKISNQLHSEISEDIYGGKVVRMALYSIGRKDNPILGFSLSKDHCQLFLHHFDKIELHGLKLNGKGKHSRHVKIRSVEEIDEAVLSKVFQSIFKIAQSKI
ncbi:MAG: DUF1801 domain-containing protein [Saprospiraceae bacterium]